MNRYVICRMRKRVFSFLLKDRTAIEIRCDREDEQSLLGNIYIGKVKNIARHIGAAFVQIDPDTVCYLQLSDLQNPIYTKKGSSPLLQAGDELLVQVSREGIRNKYPSVSSNVVLHGKYLLLTTGRPQISTSSKLGKVQKQQLSDLIASLEASLWQPKAERSFGWIIRTNAAKASEDLLKKDMERLETMYSSLIRQAIHAPAFSCLLRSPHAWVSRLSDLYEASAEEILTDDEQIWKEAEDYLSFHQPEDLHKLTFYQDPLQSLSQRFSLERLLDLALSEKVWLNSGAYLVIQPTEALTAIDVNSGKYEGGREREKAFLKVNLEAASEAARQIRLRNISGIILIDFINMTSAQSKEELMAFLSSELRADPVRTTLVDMTGLGLVEITRMKKEKPLLECL